MKSEGEGARVRRKVVKRKEGANLDGNLQKAGSRRIHQFFARFFGGATHGQYQG